MRLRRIGLLDEINNRVVKVYNVDEKKLLGTFQTMAAASKFTGVDERQIGRLIARKGRNKVNILNCTLAFR